MYVLRVNADVDIMITGAHQEHPEAEYRFRPIRPDERGLSLQSGHSRMLGLMRESSAELLDQLVRGDYHRGMALVAVVGAGATETIVAVARYSGNPAFCEFAVAVADEWQGRGIGKQLAEQLFTYAKANGVRRVYAVLVADDPRMLKLAEDLRMSVRKSHDDNSGVEAWRTL
jgi:acetyltransferase